MRVGNRKTFYTKGTSRKLQLGNGIGPLDHSDLGSVEK